jgi:hypothetical protein
MPKLRKTWAQHRTPRPWSCLLFPHPKRTLHQGEPVTRHLATYCLKRAFEFSRAPKPDGSLWHAFRRLWATERALPVKDVAAAGGWKDVTTLIECCQQPDGDNQMATRFVRQWTLSGPRCGVRWDGQHEITKITRTLTHTRPRIGKARSQDDDPHLEYKEASERSMNDGGRIPKAK